MSGRTHATRRGPVDPDAEERETPAARPAPDPGVKSNWATFKMHMEAKDWAAANADLAKKT